METVAPNSAKLHDSATDITSESRFRSNLRLRSNLFPNKEPFLTRLPQQIRGAPALKKYLAKYLPESLAAARHYLTPWQQAQLAYEVPCAKCGGLPEGLVRTSNGIEVEFRCPKGQCLEARGIARTVDLNCELITRGIQRFGGDASILAATALVKFSRIVQSAEPPPEPTFPRPIRLTRTQYYLYGFMTLPQFSAIVHECLLRLMEESSA